MREGWHSTALKHVCAIEKAKHDGTGLPYVGLEHIESNTGRYLGASEPIAVKSSTFRFTREHLLYGRLRPYLNKVLLPEFDGHCSSEIFPIRVQSTLNRRFLYYWLTWQPVVDEIDKTSTGARMPRANVSKVLEFELPLPPIPEQKRIVAILDEAFAGIATAVANTEKILANARELFESYLNSVFNQRREGWKIKKLGAVTKVQSGGTPLRSKADYWGGDIPWYSSGELNDLAIAPPARHITHLGLKNSNAKVYCEGSLLIGMYDTAALKMAILDRKATFNQAIAGVAPAEELDLRFVYFAINAVKPSLLLQRRGVRQKNLSLGKIKSIELPVPQLTIQRDVVNRLLSVKGEVDRIQAIGMQKLNALAELKQSLLQKAFAGELTAGKDTPSAILKEEEVA